MVPTNRQPHRPRCQESFDQLQILVHEIQNEILRAQSQSVKFRRQAHSVAKNPYRCYNLVEATMLPVEEFTLANSSPLCSTLISKIPNQVRDFKVVIGCPSPSLIPLHHISKRSLTINLMLFIKVRSLYLSEPVCCLVVKPVG